MNLKHKSWPIDKLIEYANNPRKNDHAVDKIAEAIKFFGFRIPIIAKSDGTVVDGHLRLKAARKLGLTKIPVMLADDLTDEQIRAFRISVNKMSELADWDEDLLRAELLDLQGIEFDMSLLGFDLEELDDLLLEDSQPVASEKEINSETDHPRKSCPQCGYEFDDH
jgi:ParB-like chromosome segregation protein Spo0J